MTSKMKSFYQILVNTLIANVTTNFLWFALTFWIYIETQSVLVTGIVGGSYMLGVAIFSIMFGSIVDHHRKKQVMMLSSLVTLVTFGIGGLIYIMTPESQLLDINSPYLWIFTAVILFGSIFGNLRNIAMATTVTLLVHKNRRANANGLVGTVTGIGFIVTSVFSGLAIGLLGMGWTLLISVVLMAVSLVHMYLITVPEKKVHHDPALAKRKIDIRGSIAVIIAIPGLFALLIFSTFNNFIGGVYMALMDPYGLTMFPVEVWGMVFGIAGTGFVVGGILVAKFGLGKNPIKTLLITVIAMGLIGALFTIREWWWLYVLGIWLYMVVIPVIEAAEQTVIQRVVPYKRQGRVFGFAQAFEASAAPITAFLIAPIAEFFIIPYARSDEGSRQLEWLLGIGDARGIALIFLGAGLIMVIAGLLAFMTKSYRKLSATYETL